MTSDMPMPIRLTTDAARNPRVGLALQAAASGDAADYQRCVDAYGAETAAAGYDHARALFRLGDGPLVGTDAACDVCLYPRDDGHMVGLLGPRLVYRRSALPSQRPFPAWPLRETIEACLQMPPPCRTAEPRVAFCGVADRPEERREMVAAIECSELDHRVIRRPAFHGNTKDADLRATREAEFIACLQWCQYALCPVGVGRFSYRYAEAMAAARIPVIGPSQSWTVPRGTHVFVVETAWTDDAIDMTHRFTRETEEVGRANRQAWLACASPFGWLSDLAEDMRRELRL